MKRMSTLTVGLLCLAGSVLTANAWFIDGYVRCPNQAVYKGVTVNVSGAACNGAFNGSATTDKDGYYILSLPDCPGAFVVSLDMSTLPAGATIVGSSSQTFSTTGEVTFYHGDWSVDSTLCSSAVCWFTGGGAKLDALLNIPVAEKGPKHSFGGNVYPGCSPTAGDGGSWNHVARDLKLHFHGRSIQVVTCGNVTPPPPPGSTSPVTPFNFIEFQGTGTLKGIQGNKADYGEVTFYARTEDRNEPGSKGARDGALIDRYYLRVTDSDGIVRLLINSNASAAPADMDPAPITSGNFQLHISSCDNPPN